MNESCVHGRTLIMRFLSIISGAFLIVLVLLDVFLTVLYARMGNGIISHRLACWTWYTFRAAGKHIGRYRDRLLSFCGPTILVLLVFTWLFGLTCGAALVIMPALGTGVQAHDG